MAKKQLVVAALTGRIYDATILKDGTMSEKGRVDRTDEVVQAVGSFMHLLAETNENQDNKGMSKLYFPGFGTLTWVSEKPEEENAEPEQTI